MSEFKSKKVKIFLDDLYVNSFKNPSNQISIVKSILKGKSKNSYKRFLKLLELDIPLSSNKYQINSMINSVSDSLSVAKELFPEFLNYATIDEYKKPIYNLFVKIIDKELIDKTEYISYKKQILNQAKIELKRQLGNKNNNRYSINNSGDLLISYVKLLFPFRNDKSVKTFFNNVEYVKNAEVKATLIALQIDASEKYNKQVFNELSSNVTSRGILYKKLHKINKTTLFPKQYNTKKEIYKAILFKRNIKKELNDSIVFIDKREFTVSKTNFEAFFYKSKINKNSTQTYGKDWKINYIIVKKDKDKISVDSAITKTNLNLELTRPIEEVIDDFVEENRLKKRKRVNIKTNRFNSYNRGIY